MKRPTKILSIYLASLVIVLAINICGNYQYYSHGGSMSISIIFSLGYTTLCWAIFMLMNIFIFKRINWSDRPTFRILTGSLLFATAGAGIMLVTEWVLAKAGYNNQSATNNIINATYSAFLSMLIGLMVTGQQALLNLKKTIEENEQMKQQMIQSQYETLKSQVNPHFLFNSLNTLTAIIPQQPGVAVTFVEQLSKVFRYSLQHSDKNMIDVATELKVVRSYLFLNEQRYEGKLNVVINISEDVLQQKIITQSLLMLAENAIKHNEISNDRPLTLQVYNEANYLVVANTLQRKTILEPSTNVGLDNIKKRYTLTTTTPVIVEDAGNNFIVKIPLLS